MKSYNKNCGQRQKMASEKYATVGRRCISLAVKGHLSEIEKTIDGDIICKLASYEDEAREAWYKAFEVLLSVEKDTKISFHFNEKLKLYALDTLLVADSLGISKKERFEALQVYIIYYLVVHVLDDLAEDHKKFRANFTMINADECEKVDFNLEAAGASFIYIALMTVNEILESGRSEPIETNKIISKFMRSIVMQIKYYTFEKIENLPPEKVFEIKQHNVSGEATAF
ncbi:MAG: hypothetical protein PHI66_05270, partial [Candidatus Pacebacteria bacterium]|nr:hypothetical protein [Candidatus Paceibacterota bacterium]